jgi:hypothetical protein
VQLAILRPAPERDHGRMLEQHHGVRNRALRDGPGERALNRSGLAVRGRAEAQQVSAAAHGSTSTS